MIFDIDDAVWTIDKAGSRHPIISRMLRAPSKTNDLLAKSTEVIAASDFGGTSTAAVGSFIEIYGTNLAGTTRMWRGSDFNKGKAPTTLDGVTATVGGKPAYISFVSAGQVNVQVPSGVSTGESVGVVVNYKSQATAPATLTIEPLAGAIFAPAAFKVNGKQYVGAYHVNGTPITNGNIHGLPAAPAAPGETVQFYGLGFGHVT